MIRRTKYPTLLCLIVAAVLLASIPAVASAQSSVPPHKFYGVAMMGEGTVAGGTLVTAMIGDEKIGEAMADATGNYVLTTMGNASYQGQEVTFRVNGQYVSETAIWMQGAISELNLTASSSRSPGSPLVPPHAFSGLATLDGKVAIEGVEIAAVIEGRTVAAAFTSSDGRYKLKVQQEEQILAGKTVTFTVDGEIADQSALWRQGGFDLLDLSAYSGPRPVDDVFFPLISDGGLVIVWMYHNDTQTWDMFDPRPEAAPINDLSEVSRGNILWLEVSRQLTFQGQTLYKGWNLIALR